MIGRMKKKFEVGGTERIDGEIMDDSVFENRGDEECCGVCQYCFLRGETKDEEEAASAVFDSDWHKEVLDVKAINKIEWNSDTARKYWEKYGVPTGKIDTEIRLF